MGFKMDSSPGVIAACGDNAPGLRSTDIAGRVAAITESEPGIPSERASEHAPGQPGSAAAEALAENHHHEVACPP